MEKGIIFRRAGEGFVSESQTYLENFDNITHNSGTQVIYSAEINHYLDHWEEIPAGKYFIKGWWTNDKNVQIKNAYVGDVIRFHVQTKDIPDGEEIIFTIYDWDGLKILNDKLKLSNINTSQEINKIKIQGNTGFLEWKTGTGTLSLLEEFAEGDEIELFVECTYKDETIELPEQTDDYLIVFEKEEIITVLIELPHSGYTDKLNSKGLGGHTAIMIGNEFYDYGPQPGEGSDVYTKGRPWWDINGKSRNLSKIDVMNILSNEFPNQKEIDSLVDDYKLTGKKSIPITNRHSLGIVGKVCLIDIHIKNSEKNRIEKWWIDKYKNLGNYSVWIISGEQCTTTVKISIKESTDVFSVLDTIATNVTQTPEGFLNLLIENGKHTNGKDKNSRLTISKEYREIPQNITNQFLIDLDIRLNN
ncbi:hypothetical protein [Flavobacterium hungaricum]|uniref:Uncharacterized protein n=1 Tax=Flavobacterium hungaricum TaxID=2082725 RepID=A0ABR9TN24_9FLAO|nr:hypothetical protein [Flavobacterium hungaricum]MBE8726763.1 hypothetical protein [Flavobacterium hungaricum]